MEVRRTVGVSDWRDSVYTQQELYDLLAERDKRIEQLERFRSAVLGWREYDHPEGFSRTTAEWVANLGEENMSPPGGAFSGGQPK